MSILENKIFKRIKNKSSDEKKGFKVTDAISLSYVFITPIIAVICINRYFAEYFRKNNEMFLLMINCAFFIGGFCVYREIARIYSKNSSDSSEENVEEEKNNIKDNEVEK